MPLRSVDMGCIRLRFLFLVLLIHLVTVADSIASARSEVEMVENNDDAKGVNKELRGTATVRTTRNKWLRGRKMSAEGLEKEDAGQAKGSVETGVQPKISSKKIFGSKTKMHDKDCRSNSMNSRPTTTVKRNSKGDPDETLKPKATKAAGSHDPFQKTETKEQLDAVTEMFNMLHKDYQTRARRRPPINNDIPLKNLHAKP